MAEQLSLFGSPEPKQALEKPDRSAEQAKPESAPEPVAAYASVVLDIPTRALFEPFAYGIPRSLANEAQIGSTVLVHFGNRAAAGKKGGQAVCRAGCRRVRRRRLYG